jgi:streptolysin S family bacteriocin protoxin
MIDLNVELVSETESFEVAPAANCCCCCCCVFNF